MRRTDGRRQRVSSTKHDTSRLHGVQTFPDHCDNRSRGHVLDQSREERLVLEVGVVYEQ
jgi:hypothetical protein